MADPFDQVFKDGENEIGAAAAEAAAAEPEQLDSRPTKSSGDQNVDEWQDKKQDPWRSYSEPSKAPQQFTGTVTHPGPGTYEDRGPRKMMHDVPPEWDGLDPYRNLEPYLKLLKGWLITTATLPQQRGMIIMNYAKGDLKRLLDNLDLEALTARESGETVFDFVKSEYSEYMVCKKPLRIEEVFYDPERCRKKGEGMVSYISRRKDRFNKLGKEGWTIPDDVKGYLLYRDAHLVDKCRELIEMWSEGDYAWTRMQQLLKKLERPIPGVTQGATRLIGYQTDGSHTEGNSPTQGVYHNDSSQQAERPVFMPKSFFLLPEAFDNDEVLFAAINDLHDSDAIWLPEDFPEEGGIPEDVFVTILANYGQVRKFLHTKALGRGYNRPSPPRTGAYKPGPKAITDRSGPGSSQSSGQPRRFQNTEAPKRFSKRKLFSRTMCARCGKDGHWARSCTNPPDEYARNKMANKASAIGNISFCTGFCTFSDQASEHGNSDITSQDARDFPASGLICRSFVLVIADSAQGTSLSAFIGLSLSTNHGLIDTGAQHGVIGLEQYERIEYFLADHGLKPRLLPTQRGGASGVGGESQFILTAEVPTAIQGICGTVKLNVLSEPIPFLLPVSFSEHLGMVLDMPDKSIFWKHIDRKQSYVKMPTGHIAVDCFEFPEDGWKNPHEAYVKPLGHVHPLNAGIKRSAFELQPDDSPDQDARGNPASRSGSPRLVEIPDEEQLSAEDIYYGPQSFVPKQAVLSLDWPLEDFHDPSFDVVKMLDGKTRESRTGGRCATTAFDDLFWGHEEEAEFEQMHIPVAENADARKHLPAFHSDQEPSRGLDASSSHRAGERRRVRESRCGGERQEEESSFCERQQQGQLQEQTLENPHVPRQ